MIRVLVVDDSETSREIISAIISADPRMEVVGTAQDGLEAVAMVKQLSPDLVTMDVHMPRMNGFEATKEIMIECPTPIVIISASTMVHEVAAGMQAMRAGALTLLLKPPGPAAADFDRAAKEITDTIQAMSEVKLVRHHRRPTDDVPVQVRKLAVETPVSRLRAVAVAASTGGPPALNTLLGGLPADFPVPILVVQHIAPGFVDGFAQWLDSCVPPTVKIAEDREIMKLGTVYIAPQDLHLGASRGGRIELSNDPPMGGFRPAASYLYESMAQAFRGNMVAVILTGMGRDGVDGLRSVHRVGGVTIAQDEESCVVFGMPGVAVREGLAKAVLPIERIAEHLLHLVGFSS